MKSSLKTELAGLAPRVLCNYRKRRYLGDDLCLPMKAFTEPDQERLRRLYDFLCAMHPLLKESGSDASGQQRAAHAFLAQMPLAKIMGETHEFGKSSVEADRSELMAKTVHDLRGGALSALFGWLQMAQLRAPDAGGLRRLFFLTRDHLKIMRNALLGLDDAKRAADLTPQLHGTDLILEKWQHALLDSDPQRAVRLELECEYDGDIAECCVEFGALDRVLYNLVNNARRHTASDEVGLFILPTPEKETAEQLRFVVCNQVSDTEAEELAARDLRTLFEPGVSNTGSGFGMTVAADFVSNAFGLTRAAALEGRYFGAKLWESHFLVWFHWPIVPDV